MKPVSLTLQRALAICTCTLLIAACDKLGEQAPDVYVQNNTSRSVFAGASDIDDQLGIGELLESGQEGKLPWTSCKTAWVVLSVPRGDKYREVVRHDLSMCPGDRVEIAADYEVTVQCGDRSRREREEDC